MYTYIRGKKRKETLKSVTLSFRGMFIEIHQARDFYRRVSRLFPFFFLDGFQARPFSGRGCDLERDEREKRK